MFENLFAAFLWTQITCADTWNIWHKIIVLIYSENWNWMDSKLWQQFHLIFIHKIKRFPLSLSRRRICVGIRKFIFNQTIYYLGFRFNCYHFSWNQSNRINCEHAHPHIGMHINEEKYAIRKTFHSFLRSLKCDWQCNDYYKDYDW